MVPIHPYENSPDVELMKEWSSTPWQTHMVHIPGLKNLQKDVKTFVTKTLVQFCPRSQSPKLIQKKEK